VIEITHTLRLDESELRIEYIRSAGPGGQNVNKVATSAQLFFDVRNSPSLPEEVKERLIKLAGSRLTTEGVLVITARRYRTQEQNRDDALTRLAELVATVLVKRKARRPTQPTRASRERRLEGKRKSAANKRLRAPVRHDS